MNNTLPLHQLSFSDSQWQEIVALSNTFQVEEGQALPRVTWIDLGHLALGKAQRIEEGHYNTGDEDEDADNELFAEELRDIADVIFNEFRPGDGNI